MFKQATCSKFAFLFLTGLVSLIIAACGGGDGSTVIDGGGGGDGSTVIDGGGGCDGSVPTVSADGFWEGSFTEAGAGTYSVRGLLYKGLIIAQSEQREEIYEGNYEVDGNNISGDISVYQIFGGYIGSLKLSGIVTEQETISVTFEGTDYTTSGSMSLSFNDLYNRESSLSLVAGVWNYAIGFYSLTFTVQDEGTISGQDSDGCLISGNIGLLDPTQNLYSVNFLFSSCLELDGEYTGFSLLLDNHAENDTLQAALSNDNYSFHYSFTRQ